MSDSAESRLQTKTWSSQAKRILREIISYHWSKLSPGGASLCTVPIAIWLVIAMDRRFTQLAVFAISGAFTTAFGAYQKIGTTRIWPMSLLIVGVASAAWAGNVAGYLNWYWPVFLTTICGLGFGAMTRLGYGGWWMGMQWMIALIVYGSHRAAPLEAGKESLAIIAGGMSQLLFIAAATRFSMPWFSSQDRPAFDPVDSVTSAFVRYVNPARSAGRYALRVAIAMAASTTIAQLWRMPNGYWIAMTAVILLKPDFHDATIRGISRLIGTIGGAVLTTIIIALVRPAPTVIAAMMIVAVWGCFAVLRVNYSLFVSCVTSYVVLLFAMLGLPEPLVAVRRFEATLIGAAIALLVSIPPGE